MRKKHFSSLVTHTDHCAPSMNPDDVFKNEVRMDLEVCENDVSAVTEKQAVCLNKPCQCNPSLSSSKQSPLNVNPLAIHACD